VKLQVRPLQSAWEASRSWGRLRGAFSITNCCAVVNGIPLRTLEKDYMVWHLRLMPPGNPGFQNRKALCNKGLAGSLFWRFGTGLALSSRAVLKGKTLTRDPKRISLVEWYQELVERVFLNYQPPEETHPASPQSEKPAEKEPNRIHDTRNFYRMRDGVSWDGAA
jgi:hypothetical protein